MGWAESTTLRVRLLVSQDRQSELKCFKQSFRHKAGGLRFAKA